MIEFEQKGFYKIKVEPEKNLYNMYFLGSWNKPQDVPNYVEHIEKTISLLKPGFMSYVEINDDKPPKLAVTGIHRKAQKIQLKAGISKCAVVLESKKILQKVSLTVVGKLSGMNTKIFHDKDKARKWLDEEIQDDYDIKR